MSLQLELGVGAVVGKGVLSVVGLKVESVQLEGVVGEEVGFVVAAGSVVGVGVGSLWELLGLCLIP